MILHCRALLHQVARLEMSKLGRPQVFSQQHLHCVGLHAIIVVMIIRLMQSVTHRRLELAHAAAAAAPTTEMLELTSHGDHAMGIDHQCCDCAASTNLKMCCAHAT